MTENHASSPSSTETVTELNPHDVLFGRGIGPDKWTGNKRLRDLVDVRKQDYIATDDYIPKALIAKEILRQVQSKGGRFLKLSTSSNVTKPCDAIVSGGEWEVVSEDVALEKIKQSLRQNRDKKPSSGRGRTKRKGETAPFNDDESSATVVAPLHQGPSVYIDPRRYVPSPFSVVNPVLPPSMLLQHSMFGSVVGVQNAPNVPVYNGHLFALLQAMAQPTAATAVSSQSSYSDTNTIDREYEARILDQTTSNVTNFSLQDMIQDSQLLCHSADNLLSSQPVQQDMSLQQVHYATTEPAESVVNNPMIDSELETKGVVDALSALAVANEPKFTDQQEALERQTLTYEERVSILADIFGQRCSINDDHRPDKRPKQDLDPDSIKFLVTFMRGEIEKVSANKKQALLEAMEKCDMKEEFSDVRLEQFLRCEGMNATAAAQRVVNYWDARREVFGPGKYLKRITLSEALQDDLSALESCTYCALPLVDLSGRPLLYSVPHSRAGKGLTTESLLRIMWYAAEVISQQNNDIHAGYIHLVWMKDANVFDFNLGAYKRLAYFTRSCLPIKLAATHVCCPTMTVSRIVKPIMYAIMKRGPRTRTCVHDVPESDIVQALSLYGITIDAIPTEMGGNLRISQSEWLANRRAAELEEIS